MSVLDLRGVILPFALLKVSNIFREIGEGECFEILWSSQDLSSIERILPAATFDLSVILESEDYPSCCRVKIRKISCAL